MDPLELIVNGTKGCLFEGQDDTAIAFVPCEFLTKGNRGQFVTDECGYFLSGWSDKNMQFSDELETAKRIFPAAERPITNANDPRVKALVKRLRHAYPVLVSP